MTSAEVASGEAGQRHDRLLDVVVDILETDGYDAVQPVADLVPHMRADIVFGGLAGRLHLRRGSFRRHRQRSQHLVRHRMSGLLLDTQRHSGCSTTVPGWVARHGIESPEAQPRMSLPRARGNSPSRRILVAQGTAERLTLLTADAKLLKALPDAVDARL